MFTASMTIDEVLGKASSFLKETGSPVGPLARQCLQGLRRGMQVGDIIAPGGGDNGGITVRSALATLVGACGGGGHETTARAVQAALSGLESGGGLETKVDPTYLIMGGEAGEILAGESKGTSESGPKKMDREIFAQAFSAAIASEEGKRGRPSTAGAAPQPPVGIFSSRPRSSWGGKSDDCDEKPEEMNWLALSAADRKKALANVSAAEAERAQSTDDPKGGAVSEPVEEMSGLGRDQSLAFDRGASVTTETSAAIVKKKRKKKKKTRPLAERFAAAIATGTEGNSMEDSFQEDGPSWVSGSPTAVATSSQRRREQRQRAKARAFEEDREAVEFLEQDVCAAPTLSACDAPVASDLVTSQPAVVDAFESVAESLSGDPAFAPIHRVAVLVVDAVRRGADPSDPLVCPVPAPRDENSTPHQAKTVGGDDDEDEGDESFFESLDTLGASVAEAVEYLARSTRPRAATRLLEALRILREGTA